MLFILFPPLFDSDQIKAQIHPRNVHPNKAFTAMIAMTEAWPRKAAMIDGKKYITDKIPIPSSGSIWKYLLVCV